jgi:hypothetical protein
VWEGKGVKTMIAAVLGGALAAGIGGLALAANESAIGIVQQGPAFVRVTSDPAGQLARHDNDEGQPDGEPYAPPKGKGHKNKKYKGERAKASEENYTGPFFRPAHAGYFRDCYQGGGGLPPGLQRHVERTGHLPPGLEMQLERNGKLPPGLQKRMSPANPCVLGRLGPLPPNSRLYMLGRDAYLINYHTRRILDIFRGAY